MSFEITIFCHYDNQNIQPKFQQCYNSVCSLTRKGIGQPLHMLMRQVTLVSFWHREGKEWQNRVCTSSLAQCPISQGNPCSSSQLRQEPQRGCRLYKAATKCPDRQFDHRFHLAARPSLLALDIR